MLRSTLWCLVTAFITHVFATQIPFHFGHAAVWQPATFNDEDLGDWSLDALPNPNSTDHLVFETVHSLLRRWPNTRMRNGEHHMRTLSAHIESTSRFAGHAIVPGIIPKGTLLYHGTSGNVVPTSSEWFATDPEHAYVFCGDKSDDCWQFTFATTRPLKVVYFDGSSAAKMPDGTLDTQDLLLWGETRGAAGTGDMQRIKDLCKWGKTYEVDAFVR